MRLRPSYAAMAEAMLLALAAPLLRHARLIASTRLQPPPSRYDQKYLQRNPIHAASHYRHGGKR